MQIKLLTESQNDSEGIAQDEYFDFLQGIILHEQCTLALILLPN